MIVAGDAVQGIASQGGPISTGVDSSFGVLLNRYRSAAGMTQEALAERAGLSVRAISDLERGIHPRPRAHSLHQLVFALQLSAADERLLGDVARGLIPDGPAGLSMTRTLPSGGFLGATPVGPLVGRKRELGRLLKAVEAVESGAGQFVLLSGEAGVGKTRLAQDVAITLRNEGFLAATGRCYEGEGTLPFYPFLEALTQVHVNCSPQLRAQVALRWPDLFRLLPDGGRDNLTGGKGGGEEQQRLFRAVAGFLVAAAQENPLALLLDDLHWADASSISLLMHLARNTRSYPLLLLGTYRDHDVARHSHLEAAIYALDRELLLQRLCVRNLDKEETRDLIIHSLDHQTISQELADLVHARTDGNPFFVVQVVRALVEQGDVGPKDRQFNRRDFDELKVPETVRTAIRQRVSRLQEGTQRALYEASVLGQVFAFDDLQAVTVREEQQLDEALQEAGEVGLIQVMGRMSYRFDHALTQQAFYEEISPHRRRTLHRAAGVVLEALPNGERRQRAAELAWHFGQGNAGERAFPYALLAGEQAEDVFAFFEAERQYRTAIGLAQETGDPRREAKSLERLAGLMLRLVRYDEALEALERMVGIRKPGIDVGEESRVAPAGDRTHSGSETHVDNIERLASLLDVLEDTVAPQVLADMYEAQARLLYHSGRHQEQLLVAERMVVLAQTTGDAWILPTAHGRFGTALWYVGRVEEAMAATEQAVHLAEAAGNLRALRIALNEAAEWRQFAGEFPKALEYRRRNLEVSERLHDDRQVSFSLCNLVETLTLLGEWKEAHEHLTRAEVMAGEDMSFFFAYPHCHLGRLGLLEGDWEAASCHLTKGLACAIQNGDLQAIRYARCDLAELDLLRGHPEATLARLEPLLNHDHVDVMLETYLLPFLAEATLGLGRHPESTFRAEEIATKSVQRATSQNDRVLLVNASRVHGTVLARQFRLDEAESTFNTALSMAHDMPYPFMEARVLHDWGGMALAAEDERGGHERLAKALTIFHSLGAHPYSARTEQALVGLEHS